MSRPDSNATESSALPNWRRLVQILRRPDNSGTACKSFVLDAADMIERLAGHVETSARSETRCTRYPECGCFGIDVCKDAAPQGSPGSSSGEATSRLASSPAVAAPFAPVLEAMCPWLPGGKHEAIWKRQQEERTQSAAALTDTPRTDAHLAHLNLPDGRKVGIPDSTVALLRQLEMELGDLQNENADLWNDKRVGRTASSARFALPYKLPLCMKEEGADRWIEDADGIPIQPTELVEAINLCAQSATRRIDGVDWCVLRDGCYQPGRCLEEKRCCHEASPPDRGTNDAA